MGIEILKGIDTIGPAYVTWFSSREERKNVLCIINGTFIKIVFSKGFWLYSGPYAEMSSAIPPTLHVLSQDPQISALFKQTFSSVKKLNNKEIEKHQFENLNFELQFHPDESAFEKALNDDQELSKQNQKKLSCCTLI